MGQIGGSADPTKLVNFGSTLVQVNRTRPNVVECKDRCKDRLRAEHKRRMGVGYGKGSTGWSESKGMGQHDLQNPEVTSASAPPVRTSRASMPQSWLPELADNQG